MENETKTEETKDTKQEETKEEVKVEEKQKEKKETKEEVKVEGKQDTKEEDNKLSALELRLKALEEENNNQKAELNSQKIKNTILEKIEDKDLQKAVLETGLVKNVEDIEQVIKIVELSKTLNKSKFGDGYKPADEVKGDAYKQAEAKGDIFAMIKQKISKQ